MASGRAERARERADGREELFFPVGSPCFGCSPTNPSGLHLRFFRADRGIVCESTIGPAHQGAPGVVHGGIQAVLLDEASCAAAAFTVGCRVMTGTLSLRYRRPCPCDVPLEVRAHVVSDEGRYLVVRAEIRTVDGTTPLTLSEGKFYRDSRRGIR